MSSSNSTYDLEYIVPTITMKLEDIKQPFSKFMKHLDSNMAIRTYGACKLIMPDINKYKIDKSKRKPLKRVGIQYFEPAVDSDGKNEKIVEGIYTLYEEDKKYKEKALLSAAKFEKQAINQHPLSAAKLSGES